MYKCNNCRETFYQPILVYEKHGLDTPPYEPIWVCPYCRVNDWHRNNEEIEEE